MTDAPTPASHPSESPEETTTAATTTSTYGYAHRLEYVNDFWVSRYERENGRNWERFYAKGRKGYLASTRNREYLSDDLAADLADAAVLLEVGCGAGHAIAPLARTLPRLRFLAVDVSPRAVALLRANPDVPQDRCEAHACDVQHEEIPRPTCPLHSLSSSASKDHEMVTISDSGSSGDADSSASSSTAPTSVPPATCCCAGVDCALLIFVMSSLAPEAHDAVLRHVRHVLAPGAVVLFRDYARGDANQLDFDRQYPPRKLAPNFYVRPDGTRAYFFALDDVIALFQRCGFDTLRADVVTFKKRTNDRFFINAKFRLRSDFVEEQQ